MIYFVFRINQQTAYRMKGNFRDFPLLRLKEVEEATETLFEDNAGYISFFLKALH